MNNYISPLYLSNEKIICGCGCKTLTHKYDKRSRIRKFVRGHGCIGQVRVPRRPCLICGNVIKRYGKRQKYCSRKCFAKSAQNHSFVNCLYCGKSFKAYPAYQKMGWEKYCSHKCSAKSRIKEKNSNWRGGKSFEPYTKDFDNTIKNVIKYRDNHKCQICGVPEMECLQMDTHHIDYNKKNNSIDNLILLCSTCHGYTNGSREYWRNKLSDIVSNSV